MSHPPFAHNPHVYNGIDPDGNPTTGLVVQGPVVPPEVAGEHGPELTDLPAGQEVPVNEAEGGEQPSQTPNTLETEAPAGTGSSDSSKPAGKPAASGGSGTRSRARGAGNPSGPAATTE